MSMKKNRVMNSIFFLWNERSKNEVLTVKKTERMDMRIPALRQGLGQGYIIIKEGRTILL